MLYLVEGAVQPEAFGNIPRALWWSGITLTTVGYGDVYPVTVAGRMAALAGRPSMDMLTIDVTEVPEVSIGDRVELWGPAVPIERVAWAAGTIGYELACRVGRRVRFVVSGT